MTASAPRICCLDLDTFFVSVERLLDPALVGEPVIVGGRKGQRGVVTACSYEARDFGVRSGMSLTKAAELAPRAIFMPATSGVYSDYAEKVRNLAADTTPVLQVASIDEMYLDYSGCEALYRQPLDAGPDDTIERVVRELTLRIRSELGLPSSAGIATSKRVAKIACGLAKPAGVMLVPSGDERRLLEPLPVRKLPGIGPVAERRLHERGIETLGQLAEQKPRRISRVFGAWTESVLDGARGIGSHDLSRDRPAFREYDRPGDVVGSISNERTFREDVGNPRVLEAQLCSLAERVCWRARNRGVLARTVTVKFRYSDFETLSRARTVAPTCSELEVYPVVRELFSRHRQSARRVRLLGVALSKLEPAEQQLQLFDEDRYLNESVDRIRAKYGFDAVRRALSHGRR